MTTPKDDRPRAMRPEDLGSFFIDRANAGDVDGLVALYERDAVLVRASGEVARGIDSIRQALEAMVAGMAAQGTIVTGAPSPAVRRGDLALTSTRFSASHTGGAVSGLTNHGRCDAALHYGAASRKRRRQETLGRGRDCA